MLDFTPFAACRPSRQRSPVLLVTALLIGGVPWMACRREDAAAVPQRQPSSGLQLACERIDWSSISLAGLRSQPGIAELALARAAIPPDPKNPLDVLGWLRATVLAGQGSAPLVENTIGILSGAEPPEAVGFLRWWAAVELAGESLAAARLLPLLLAQTDWQYLPADQQADGLAQLVRFLSNGLAGLSPDEQKAALWQGLKLAASLRQIPLLLPACDRQVDVWMAARNFKEAGDLLDYLEKLAAETDHDPQQPGLRAAAAQRLARFLFRRRAFAQALDKLEPFLTDEAVPEAWLLAAQIAWENQQLEKSQLWAERLFGQNPLAVAVENPGLASSAHLVLGRCLRASGRWSEALYHLELASQLRKETADAVAAQQEQDVLSWEKGSTLAALQRYAEASAELENLAERMRKKLANADRSAAPFLELAKLSGELTQLYEKSGERQRAIQSCREKLQCQEAALERTFRTDSLQQEIARTRAHLARLLAEATGAESSLADSWQALCEQLVLAPETREIQDTWLAVLQRYASRQIAAGDSFALPALFQQAAAVVDAVAAAGASPAQVDWLKLRLLWEQTSILEKAGLSGPAAEALLHAHAVLTDWPLERPLEDTLRRDLVHALLAKADDFYNQMRLRDAHQIVQQARRFVPPRQAGDPLRILVLCGVAKIQLAREREEPAWEFLRIADEETEVLPDGPERTLLQWEVARQRATAQLRLGNAPSALSIVEKALAKAGLPEAFEQEERRSLAGLWGTAAEAHLQVQDWGAARSALEMQQKYLLQMVHHAVGGEDRDLQLVRNYRQLAFTWQQLGEADRALRLIEAATRLASSLRPAVDNAARVIEEVELHLLACQLHRQKKMSTEAEEDGARALALLDAPALRSAVPFEQQRKLAALVWREIARIREEDPGRDVIEALQQTYRALLEASTTPALPIDDTNNPQTLAGRIADLCQAKGDPAQAYFWRWQQRRLIDSSLRAYPDHRGLSQEWLRTVLLMVDTALTQSLWVEAETGLNEVLNRISAMQAQGLDVALTAAWELQALRLTARLYSLQSEWSAAWEATQDAWLAWQRLPPAVQQREDVRREALLNLAAAKSLAERENRQAEWQNLLFSFREIRDLGFPGDPSSFPEVTLVWNLLENLPHD